jgi:hypothetical protein
MSDANPDQMAQWQRTMPIIRGTLARGIRFADETFVSDGNDETFSASALQAAWRLVADAFQVLRAQHLPPTRLTWVHERTVLHFVQRADGAILGVIVKKKIADVDTAGLEQLLTGFQSKAPPTA